MLRCNIEQASDRLRSVAAKIKLMHLQISAPGAAADRNPAPLPMSGAGKDKA
jgi:hypothetical protein